MREISGDLHIVDYKTKMVIASLKPEDYIEDLRHWELKDNADILDIKLLDESPFLIYFQQKNLILKETRPGVITPYVITEIAKDSAAHTATVYASGEWIKLDKDAYISPQKITSKDAAYYMNFATARTIWEVGVIEAVGTRTMTIDTFISPLRFIKEVATLFDNLEIQYRIVMNPTKPPTRYIDLVKKRGRETDKEIILGKDLLGIKRIENSENIITALVPFVMGRDADGNDKLITIESVNNGLQYIVDEAAYQRWNVDGKHLFGFYTPETDNEDMAPARLLTLAKAELKKRVDTIVSYEVDSVDISRVFGYEHEAVGEGDTIRIIDEGMTPTLYLEARAVAGDESRKDKRKNKYTFGNFVEIINPDEALRKLYQKMLTMIGDKVPKEWFGALETKLEETKKKVDTAAEESQTAKDLANATKDYMDQNMVDIIESVKPPTSNLKPNKTLWRDISGGKPGILKIWTGTTWESVVPDVEKVKKETLEQVSKDIESTKTELNKKVQEAQNQATGQVNEVKESLQGFSRTISDVQNKQGEIDKKVTKFEQDSSGFKTSIESLTKKDTEISNKLNTVEQTVEGTKKTISDVQQTANDLKKTTTEIKEEAGKIATKLEQVDGRTVGGENWLINTGQNQRPQTIGMSGGAQVNKAGQAFSEDYMIVECTDHTDSFYQFHLDNTKMGDYEKGKDMTFSIDFQNDVPIDLMVFQFINGAWAENLQNKFLVDNWSRRSFTFKLDVRATGWGLRLRFERNENSKGKKFRFKKAKLEKGSVPTDFSKSTYELEQSVDGVKTTVTNVQNSQAGFEKRVNTVEQTANSNSQSITLLIQTQGQQGPIIQQNTSDITQLSNQIKSKVSDTQMQDYVGGLGSVNMYFNSAFEDRVIHTSTGVVTSRTPSLTKWNKMGITTGTAVTPTSARNHDGYNSAQIQATGLTVNTWTGINQLIPVSAGSGKLVLSTWIFTNDKAGLDAGGAIELKFLNGGTVVGQKSIEFKNLLTNGSWTFLSLTLGIPTSAVTHVQAAIYLLKNGLIWASQPQVQQGENPSTFMENPKDYANYDQLVGEIAKKVATTEFNSKVSTLETSINQQSKNIELRAEKTDVYTKTEANGQFGSKAMVESHNSSIMLMADAINQRVEKGQIASTINQTAQSVLIQAGKIYLDGYIEAKHLKAQTLQGVTIQTAPAGSGANQIRLNAQNLTVYGGGRSRGYLGFVERTDGNIQSALVLGNDYEVNKQLEGSLVIDQVTQGTAWTNAVASIGIASGGKTDNDINKSSYINFYRYMDKMEIRSQGPIEMNAIKGDIKMRSNSSNGISIDSATYMNFNSNTATYLFKNGRDIVDKWTLKMSENDINSGDVDLNIGNQLTLRVARAYPYTMEGLQVKNNKGNDWAGVSCGVLTYASLSQRSTRQLKTAIKDIEAINPLDKLMELHPRQYYMKEDVNKLYEKRQDILDSGSGERIPTYEDIPQQYGFIAEEVPEEFATPHRKAVNMYPLITMGISGTQEVYKKHLALEETVKTQAEKLEVQAVSIQAQEDRIARLEELLLQQLINKKPEQP
ncbi:phage tail spike protein [Bacillus mycoides]|uniref:phage tail spike protein n=1 Tax=Bacillus mycoides TaxID=1405 RepID=UPI003D06A832